MHTLLKLNFLKHLINRKIHFIQENLHFIQFSLPFIHLYIQPEHIHDIFVLRNKRNNIITN